MGNIKFMALGGQDERGKNLYVLEIDDELFVLDAGLKFPDKGILGVDMVIPNFDYLKDNRQRVKAIFLTNASAYNSGATNYLLKDLDVPVYCNPITAQVLKIKAQRARMRNRDSNYHVVHDKEIINFTSTKVEVFRLTASSPQTLGFAFSTKQGAVIYLGDYIIDGQEQSSFSTDFANLAKISERGVLALISDTASASRRGFTAPNHKIESYIATPFKEKHKRIIIGIFEEDLFKVGEIIRAAQENNRKIAVYGRTMSSLLDSNLLADFNVRKEDLMSPEEYKTSENGVLIISGNAEVLYSKLNKIANNNDEVVDFTENDLVILATPPAPGVEKRHAQILDELARTEARIMALSDRNIWAMNSSYEDLKVMVSIFKPKYFIPIKALYKDFLEAESAALSAGVKPGNVGIIDNGQVLNLAGRQLAVTDRTIKNGDTYVDGLGIGDIGNVVLNERKQLASDGVIIVGVSIDSRSKALVSSIDIQMRGVIYIKEENTIFKTLQKQIADIMTKGQSDYRTNPSSYDLNEIKKEIITKVRSVIKQESGKQPMVLAIANEINEKDFTPFVRPSKNLKTGGNRYWLNKTTNSKPKK
ncbi:ribonuclease J [Entomoplasma freundtii]|nr:ribonuclease J [Entomoplasma freundtii]